MAGLDLVHEAEGGDPPLPPPNLPFLKLECESRSVII